MYFVDRSELEPLAHLGYRSDAAFDWGDSTEGALELAFAMLAHATHSRPTDLVCEAFCAEVVARLDSRGLRAEPRGHRAVAAAPPSATHPPLDRGPSARSDWPVASQLDPERG